MLDFKINQDYIAKVLCVNKDEPQKGCNGKCHLSKQMQQAEEKEQKQLPQSVKEKNDFVFYLCSSDMPEFINKPTKNILQFEYATTFYNFLFKEKIFHPPRLL